MTVPTLTVRFEQCLTGPETFDSQKLAALVASAVRVRELAPLEDLLALVQSLDFTPIHSRRVERHRTLVEAYRSILTAAIAEQQAVDQFMRDHPPSSCGSSSP